MGGGVRADIECYQKPLAFKQIPFEQWRSQDRIFVKGRPGLQQGGRKR